ncbi:nose resistant to fluoxetine protein 6-like isoform X5 [Hermetia illucens]|uniref:nose resistant to fluoxetine protein 6-like isoform X5 n=1 Tax=Hermetia illucens TaxID=343691 RepID=UPI0018CC3B5C|nr:nose resistant to fluoxetine protein 6-like isoform X5 [Hermetia illucens]
MVANRYLRLTPPYVISLLLTVVITNLVKDLSPYYLLDDDETKCGRTWWRNVIYINNLFPIKDSCMIWSWFLGADFQCFVLSAALLLIFDKNRKLGLTLFTVIFLASSSICGYYGYSLGFGFTQDSLHKTADFLYTPFWGRIGAYFTGVYAGWYLSVKNRTLNLGKKWITLGWILGPLIIVVLLFGHSNKEISPLVAMTYAALARTAWGVGTVWIIIACSTGYGGIVNRFLSAKVFLPFSRMTYSAYLVNPIWILFVTMLNEAPYTIDFPMLPVMSMGFATTIYALAFLFMLLFENPFIRLVKVLTS